jgi:hypothetical protein
MCWKFQQQQQNPAAGEIKNPLNCVCIHFQEQYTAYSATDWSSKRLLIGVLLAAVTAIRKSFRFHDLPQQQIWGDNRKETGEW